MHAPERAGYCIYCGKQTRFNPKFPFCLACGGKCSATERFSSTDDAANYCHGCGEPAYVSSSSPLCEVCRKNAGNA
nr:hypothetical protein [Candidatus Sigynarchaeota archaeon]